MYLIKDIKGVGKKTLKIFNTYNIFKTNDLLNYYPIKYDIFNKTKELNKLDHNQEITIYTQIVSNIEVLKYSKVKLSKFKVLHNKSLINVVAFNQIYLNNIYKENDFIYLNGTYNYYKNEIIVKKIFSTKSYNEIKPIYNFKDLHDTNISKIIKKKLKI